MVDDGDGSFKRPGAVPFNWEIRPGVPKTRNPQIADDPTLLHPPKKLPPLRLKPSPPSSSSSSSSSSISQFKTRPVSPFAPPPSFNLKSPTDSDYHSTGPPTPYWRSSSPRTAGDALSRWRFLKPLLALKKRKSGDVKKARTEESSTSSESDNFYESETTFSPSEGSSQGSASTNWGSPKSSFSSRPASSLRRNQSDLSSYVAPHRR